MNVQDNISYIEKLIDLHNVLNHKLVSNNRLIIYLGVLFILSLIVNYYLTKYLIKENNNYIQYVIKKYLSHTTLTNHKSPIEQTDNVNHKSKLNNTDELNKYFLHL